MSTVVSKNVQIGADGTASNNFTAYQPATPDGTLRIGNGNSGSVTDAIILDSSGNLTLNSATVNGVGYFNGSKVLTSGSALTFDGSGSLIVSTSASNGAISVVGPSSGANSGAQLNFENGASTTSAIGTYSRVIGGAYNESLAFFNNGNDFVWYSGSERMRLTSTGLGIGTSSPSAQLQLNRVGTGDYTTFRLSNSGASGKTYEIGVGGNTSAAGYANNLYFYDSTAGALRMTLDSAGELTTTNGKFNLITVGRGAGAVATNTAVGVNAIRDNTSGNNNTAVGTVALRDNTTGSHNVAVGTLALIGNISGSYNTAVGAGIDGVTQGALGLNTTGSNNTGIGYQALRSNTTASNNTAVGYQAGFSNSTGGIDAFGYKALYANTTAVENVGIGTYAMQATTTGRSNVSVGVSSMYFNTTGQYNVAVGKSALESNTSGNYLTAIGHNALVSNTTAEYNVAVGQRALQSNTTGQYNVSVGANSLYSNTTASYNTAVGYQAGFSNTTGTINAFGAGALYSNTSGVRNAAFGAFTLNANTVGSYNSAFGGYDSSLIPPMYYNTTGSYNTAMGNGALASNTTANNNTAVGYQAGYNTTTGYDNTFIGFSSGTTNTTGYFNTFVGDYSGYSHTTGVWNTCIGKNSGYALTTGSKNTIIGGFNGNQGGLDIRTASNYIVLSDGDGIPRGIFDGSGNFMVGTASTTSRFVSYRGDAGFNGFFDSPSGAGSGVYAIGTSLASSSNNANCAHLRCTTQGVGTWQLLGNGTSTFSSDERLKKNIETARSGYLDDVASLRVVKYNWHTDDDSTAKELGLIAQEVEQIFPGLVVEDNTPLGDVQNPKAIKTSVLPYILLKAIQEQQAIINSLKARLDAANL